MKNNLYKNIKVPLGVLDGAIVVLIVILGGLIALQF